MENETFIKFRSSLLLCHRSFNDIFEIVEDLENDNFFVAGGAVRDFLCYRGNTSKDVDLFISNLGLRVLRPLLETTGYLIKNQFGNFRWFPEKDGKFYFDVIVIENFFNGLWECQNIKDVLAQFDFTANAVAFDLKSGKFYNPLNGLKHANEKKLRAVRFDYPEISISESVPISRNSVLWFRYIYYAKKLGYTIEPVTKSWLEINSFRLNDKSLFTKYFFDPDL